MNRLFPALVASVVVAAPALADTPKPLRTLVYDITYSTTAVQETRDSGIGGSASGRESTTVAHTDRGPLTLDILAATADGGLVVQATFSGTDEKQPPVIVALASDGTLKWNKGAAVSDEAMRVLPLLARGIVEGRDLSAGASWSAPVAPPGTGTWNYKVRSRSGTTANLDITYTSHEPAPVNIDETGQATAVYETYRVCPLEYDLHARARMQSSIERSRTTDYTLVAKLQSDTMADTKPQ